MLLSRGRSKDRNRKVTPPGPVYMNNDQFASYLSDLRNNRVARPSGARPPPPSNRREQERRAGTPTPAEPTPESPVTESVPRSSSVLSHRRARSSLSTYSSVTSRSGRHSAQSSHPSPTSTKPLKPSDVVPTATYMERGLRWMEKEEAVSLREAMEDMDLKKQEEEEARIHSAAQDEASELVFQHQHPEAVVNPDAPFRYKDHLRKNSYQHARAQSVGGAGGMTIVTGMARDLPRSVSGGSSSSGGVQSPRSPISCADSEFAQSRRNGSPDAVVRGSLDAAREQRPWTGSRKSLGRLSSISRPQGSIRRSSSKRNVSGEIAGIFTGEQIWEEPEQEDGDRGRASEVRDLPAPLRIKARNPLNRVQFDMDPRSSSSPPEATKRLSTSEIHRNPPSQSRNANYTANPPPAAPTLRPTAAEVEQGPAGPMKDGLEIRSEEIRQATSMRLRDRSPKLPTPTAVSNKPGRPIVSFDSNWKPSEADVKPEVRRRSPFDRRTTRSHGESIPARSAATDVTPPLPTVQLPDNIPSIQVNQSARASSPGHVLDRDPDPDPVSIPIISFPASTPSVPTINRPDSKPTVPTINLPDSKPTVPTINLPDSKPTVPTINLPDSKPTVPTINLPDSKPTVPTINLPDAPTISVSAPSVPHIHVASTSSTTPQSKRPLPTPTPSAGRPAPRHAASASVPVPVPRGHWSAAGRRATATCHQCQLPIEGKVVKLSGAAEHFHPECFICFTCGTGLESLEIHPEPRAKRAARLDRIRRRAGGEEVPELEGQTTAEDGDARLRFYCHLDFHENFAPRCKHCTTTIIGEHLVALGQSWHYGHFFCAECGDPFEKGMTHIEKDGYAWCLSCQTKRTERQAPKCTKCQLAVIGEYVQALGGEWHEKCFRCARCQRAFNEGAFYPLQVGEGTAVLCLRCIERELKA
ncbi:LIM domain-containing protein [Diplocarpon rosae]|nr:LIM domain-containing protein [Diplocarpon rosae]